MNYTPNPEIVRVLEKWTCDDKIISNDIRLLWEEICRLALLVEPGKSIDTREKGSGT